MLTAAMRIVRPFATVTGVARTLSEARSSWAAVNIAPFRLTVMWKTEC